jgi:hypothetical protein
MGNETGLPRNIVRAREYTSRAPKSKCRCGHTGDGANGQHEHSIQYGHGACKEPGCDCGQFRWAGWTKEFEKFIDEG